MALPTELFEGGGPMILEEPLLDDDMDDSGVPPKPSTVQRTEFIVVERSAAVSELAVFYDFGENITCYRLGHISKWSLPLSTKYDGNAGMVRQHVGDAICQRNACFNK